MDMAQESIVRIFVTAIQQQKVTAATEANEALYNIAVAMFHLVQASPEVRMALAGSSDCQTVMLALLKHRYCSELAVTALFHLLNDGKTRPAMCSPAMKALLDVLKNAPHKDTLYNGVSAIYVMSKYPDSRAYLSDSPINADQFLLQVNVDDDAKLKANIARAMKNLQSDANEAIEEGVVASLIAISLEGKQQKTKVGDDTRKIMSTSSPQSP